MQVDKYSGELVLTPLDGECGCVGFLRPSFGGILRLMRLECLSVQVAQLDLPRGTSTVQTGCALNWQPDGLERRSDGVYLRATAQARCSLEQALRFNYSLLKD